MKTLKKEFKEEFLRKYWGNGKPLIYKGKRYRVGRMNYGDYFFEPFSSERGETEGFDSETLWLVKIEHKKGIWEVDE